MKTTTISTITNFSQQHRASCKSEQSITPLRVPFNGGSQQNCLSKKSCNLLAESLIFEYKQLCQWIVKEIAAKTDIQLLISNVNKQLFQFERLLSKKIDSYTSEIQALKLVHKENQTIITKLNSTNQDLKGKLMQISNGCNEESFSITPLKRKHNYSIELITKQPMRNVSYSLQEASFDKENRQVEIRKKQTMKPKFRI